MLTVGAGDGSNFQVGQAPQLYMVKDNVDERFRIQLAGSGYSGYQLQIGRDDGTHEVLLKGDIGIGTDNPTYPLHVASSTTAIRGEGDDAGVSGMSGSPDGIGVHGDASALTGVTNGVFGESSSNDGCGVYGFASSLASGASFGVLGVNDSPTGKGVYGAADNSSGVNIGVLGNTISAEGYGVFSNGELGASGTKSFVIDHPFDPENKYLKHYASEGPEPLNVYRGRVTLNGWGEARIALPEYFEAINRDALYSLTPIGAAMPNLHVAEEVSNNEFRIAGGEPGMDVSWRVEAVRNDPFVRARGALVEVEKAEHERGLYQFPELYDQPPEKGINHALMHRQPSEDD